MTDLRQRAQDFATAARRSCDALEQPPADREEAALLLLRSLASVYAKALALDWAGGDYGEPHLDRVYPVVHEARRRVMAKVKVMG